MQYELQNYDGTLMFQPKNLLTRKDEHELFWAGLTLLTVALVSAVITVEQSGIVDAFFTALETL